MWGIHHRNSSLPFLCRLRWGEDPQNRMHYFWPRVYKIFFLFTVIGKPLESDHQESLANASQNTATKSEPAQYSSVQISLVSYWMEPKRKLHVSLNSIAQFFHVVCIQQWDQGKHQGSTKRNILSVKKKKAPCIWPTVRPWAGKGGNFPAPGCSISWW